MNNTDMNPGDGTFLRITNKDIYREIKLVEKSLGEINENLVGIKGEIKSNKTQINRIWWLIGILLAFVLGLTTSMIMFYINHKGVLN